MQKAEIQKKTSPQQELEEIRAELWEKRKQEMPVEHAQLYEMLNGKHPKDMSLLIADTFEKLFPNVPNVKFKVLLHLHPEFNKKQPITFDLLQKRLSTLEEWFSDNSPCHELINSFMLVFQLLRKPGNKHRKERVTINEDASFPPEKIAVRKCRFCWRTVWRYPVENGTLKCLKHTFRSGTKEYKHIRIVEKRYNSIFTDITKHYQRFRREVSNKGGSKISNEAFTVRLCSLLPNVSAFIDAELSSNPQHDKALFESDRAIFLESGNHADLEGIPLKQQPEYMRNHPRSGAGFVRTVLDILDPHEELQGNLALAQKQFVLDMTWNFAAYTSYLFDAEAWIVAEKMSQHGGKRELSTDMT